jgi:hypothetical protein
MCYINSERSYIIITFYDGFLPDSWIFKYVNNITLSDSYVMLKSQRQTTFEYTNKLILCHY